MAAQRVVAKERGKHLADELGLEFFETSAKENVNVKQVFERLVDMVCERLHDTLQDPSNPSRKRDSTNSQNVDLASTKTSSSCTC